ncbi:MAG: hypothetical protein R2911_04455 [Caldilineaceae bacterium]
MCKLQRSSSGIGQWRHLLLAAIFASSNLLMVLPAAQGNAAASARNLESVLLHPALTNAQTPAKARQTAPAI